MKALITSEEKINVLFESIRLAIIVLKNWMDRKTQFDKEDVDIINLFFELNKVVAFFNFLSEIEKKETK